MANVTFNLKSPTESKSLIMMIFSFDYFELGPDGKKKYKSMKVSTNERIDTKDWDLENQKPKKIPRNGELITRLRDLETAVLKAFRRMVNDGLSPTPASLKTEYLQEAHGNQTPETTSKLLIPYIEQYIKSIDRKEWTKKGYRTTQTYLEEYQNLHNKVIRFEDVNLDFYDAFVQMMKRKGKAPNTIGKHIKNTKVFLNSALDRGLTESRQHQSKRFKTIEEETESIYLSEHELSMIYKVDLSGNLRLDRVRDLFLVGSYTGLRFADLSQINNGTFFSDESGHYMKVKTQKTEETVVIPLRPLVLEIMAKYQNRLPRSISNQKMNEYIKQVGEKAEIPGEVVLNQTQGYLKIPKTVSKFNLITVHTARRSFATNAYLAGVPTISIMKLTGHRTERAFMRYIKISQEDNARKLSQHPHFSSMSVTS